MKRIHSIAFVIVAFFVVSQALAGSTRTQITTDQEGNKITTKIKTDNQGTTTTVVTVKDKSGQVTTKTTVADKDGTIISTDDPDAQTQADAAAKEKQEKQAALANAPKRQAADPIQVALFQTVISENLRKATTKDGVFPYLRKEFENDAVIKLLDQSRVDRYVQNYDFKTGQYKSFSSLDRKPDYLPADIYVESYAKMEEKVGISKATQKLASAPFLVYTAVITSEYSDQKWDVKEEGYILANLEVTKKFAGKIRAVILSEAGATIPQDASKFRRGTGGASPAQADAGEALRNLFKKKKK